MTELLTALLLGFVLLSPSYLNPLALSLNIIFLTIALAMNFWVMHCNWLAMSMILIFVGGMMVIFIYISSLSEASKILSPIRPLRLKIFALAFFTTFYVSISPSFNINSFLENLDFSLVLILTVLLLSTLFITVKISQSFKGSIVKKF